MRGRSLRRALGRSAGDDEAVDQLATLERLGAGGGVGVPGALPPAGARTEPGHALTRAARTGAAARLSADWVWPSWLHRQLDPRSPAFVPRGHLPLLTNVAQRNWTVVGNIGSDREAIVDPRGLVTPWPDGWSLDWWIGADDRWHFPSTDSGVRQRLLRNSPVVETAMRVPGGDAVQRVYGVPAPRGGDTGELVVVEIENCTSVPFAVALAVRPYNPEGVAVVERVAVHDRTVSVDGRPALLLPRAPARAAGSTFAEGDCAAVVLSGGAVSELAEVRDGAGMATAAFLLPLAHKATLRVAVPLAGDRRTGRSSSRSRPTRRGAGPVPQLPQLTVGLPSAGDAAQGWEAQTRRGMQLVLPQGRLADAVAANRRYLLLFHNGDEVTAQPFTDRRFRFQEATSLVTALDRYGFSAEAAEVLVTYPERQRDDGCWSGQPQEPDANGAALHALAEHWRLTGDTRFVAEQAQSVAAGVSWIERTRHRGHRRRRGHDEVLPGRPRAGRLSPFDDHYPDAFWSLRGVLDGVALLRAAGEATAAEQAAGWGASMRADLTASMRAVRERLGTDVLPAGARRNIDAGMVDTLVACASLDLLAVDDPVVAATLDAARERFCVGDAFVHGTTDTGLGTYLTMQVAAVELRAGDRRALDRLAWMLRVATPTFTWPEAVHPQLESGCAGDGHHGRAAAELLSFVRSMLVRETSDGLAVFSMLPHDWLGQPIEVHDAPTHHGRLSLALRWHGERPALLWDLRPHDGAAVVERPVALTAPGLDSSWSTTQPSGEALLAPMPAGVPS